MSSPEALGSQPSPEELAVLEGQLLAAAGQEHEQLAPVIPIHGEAAPVTGATESKKPLGSTEINFSHAEPATKEPEESTPSDESDTNAGVMGGRFSAIEQKVYKNGAKHVYGKDSEGKHRHLSHDEILEAYGHAGEYQGKRPEPGAQLQTDAQTDTDAGHNKSLMKLVLDARTAREAGDTGLVGSAISEIIDKIDAQAVTENWTERQKTATLKNLRQRIERSDVGTNGVDPLDGAASNPNVLDNPADPDALIPPVTDLSDKGIRARLSAIYKKAQDISLRIGTELVTGVQKAGEYLSDEQEGKRRRRNAGIVLGAAAVGYAFMQLKGIHLSGGTGAKETVLPPPQPKAEAVQHATESLSRKGDTIWKHAEERLRHGGVLHPTNAQIHQETQALLELNNLSWEEAKHLKVGTKIKVS